MPIWQAMTRRMLLMLIAILTGLSWQGPGVQARAMPASSQVSAVSALATVRQAKVSAVAARPVIADPNSVALELAPIAQVDTVVPVAAVLPGIDRAHE